MSTPWIVHQYAPSPNAERLRRVLVRLELPFEVEDYLPFDAEGRARVAELVEKSGHNQIPVLERDGQFYGDSLAITEMLLQEYPDKVELLYPANPTQAAAVHAYVTAGDAGLFRPEGKFLTADFVQRKGEDHAAKILRFGHARREATLAAWDHALLHHPFLVGDAYTMADIGVVPYLNATIALPKLIHAMAEQGIQTPFVPEQWPLWDIDVSVYPQLSAWIDHCNAPEFTESGVAAA